MLKYISLVCLLSISLMTTAQNAQRNLGTALLFNMNYATHIPAGDLSKRFGTNLYLGGGLEIMTSKNNYIFGLEGGVIFGNNVKEDVISTLRTPEGFIVAGLNGPVSVDLRERGMYLAALIGKLFPISEKNKRAGIRGTLGLGFLQHKVRIQDNSNSAPQINSEYRKGYDRLSNGLSLNQFIGYQVLSNNRRVNFIIGLEFTQAFTKSRRDFNFDTRSRDDSNRIDLLFGIRAGWTLPFYFGESLETIYY